MINTFVTSGEVKRVEVNNKQTKKGPAAIILVQYGPNRQKTPDQAVQFLHIALIRVPPYVFEKCKNDLKVGSLVDVTGHIQGVLKQVIGEGYVTNELVADRLQVVDSESVEPAEPEAAAA